MKLCACALSFFPVLFFKNFLHFGATQIHQSEQRPAEAACQCCGDWPSPVTWAPPTRGQSSHTLLSGQLLYKANAATRPCVCVGDPWVVGRVLRAASACGARGSSARRLLSSSYLEVRMLHHPPGALPPGALPPHPSAPGPASPRTPAGLRLALSDSPAAPPSAPPPPELLTAPLRPGSQRLGLRPSSSLVDFISG